MDSPRTTLEAWDIKPILDMLHSCSLPTTKSITKHDQTIATPTPTRSETTGPANFALGDFDGVWRALGKPIDIPTAKDRPSFEDSSLSSSKISNTSPSSVGSLSAYLEDYSTPYSSLGSDEELVKAGTKKVQVVEPIRQKRQKVTFNTQAHVKDDLGFPSVSSHQALLNRRTDDKFRKEYSSRYIPEVSSESEAEIELDALRHDPSPLHRPNKHSFTTPVFTAPSSLESQTGWLFTPGWVKPVPVQLASILPTPGWVKSVPVQLAPILPTPCWVKPVSAPTPPTPPPYLADVQLDPLVIQPRLTLTLAEKKELLVKKISKTYGMDKDSMSSARRALTLTQEGGNESDTGIHVFVDWSNIVIGFQEVLKKARGIPTKAYIKRPPVSYSSFALIMERGRPVARRVLAGSTTSDRILDELHEAERCGYELNILERVKKARTPKKYHSAGSGYATSGLSSGPETANVPTTMGEQAVDELLHMKMLESIVDRIQSPNVTKPTMIVATGDGAAAEYSGGFFKQVGRALQAGWNVELVTWRGQLASVWRERVFMEKWHKKFSIILLDDFAEELLAVYPRHEYGR